jgi:hypothetical protein
MKSSNFDRDVQILNFMIKKECGVWSQGVIVGHAIY